MPVGKKSCHGLCMTLGEISRNDVNLAGGKGGNLGDMVKAGLPVPPGFVLSAAAYEKATKSAGLELKLKKIVDGADPNDSEQLLRLETAICGLFEGISLGRQLNEEILASYRALGPNISVAVRSSATAEDLAGASFAGQQATFLNVSGKRAVLDAIKRCWASLFSSRAIFYRFQKGFSISDVSMAVVVQKMINTEKAGVVFTVDPVNKDNSKIIIEAVWGLGEGIVSGMMTPDHYEIRKGSLEILYEFVPEKREMITQAGGGGIITSRVPSKKISARVLNSFELERLADLGIRAEQHFHSPQDVEWGIEQGRVYILQSRPITNL